MILVMYNKIKSNITKSQYLCNNLLYNDINQQKVCAMISL